MRFYKHTRNPNSAGTHGASLVGICLRNRLKDRGPCPPALLETLRNVFTTRCISHQTTNTLNGIRDHEDWNALYRPRRMFVNR